MEIWLAILLLVVVAVVCGAVGFFMGISHRKKVAEGEIGSAEQLSLIHISEPTRL